MFEVSYNDGVCTITARNATVHINVERAEIEAGLNVGVIRGAGEFEIGEVSIIGTMTPGGVMYVAEDDGIRIGVTGGVEQNLDELGPIDVLVTASVKAVKEVGPKVVVATEQVEKFAEELKVEVKREKKLKIKNAASLPATLELYKLG
jgi:hypothetical protein